MTVAWSAVLGVSGYYSHGKYQVVSIQSRHCGFLTVNHTIGILGGVLISPAVRGNSVWFHLRVLVFQLEPKREDFKLLSCSCVLLAKQKKMNGCFFSFFHFPCHHCSGEIKQFKRTGTRRSYSRGSELSHQSGAMGEVSEDSWQWAKPTLSPDTSHPDADVCRLSTLWYRGLADTSPGATGWFARHPRVHTPPVFRLKKLWIFGTDSSY